MPKLFYKQQLKQINPQYPSPIIQKGNPFLRKETQIKSKQRGKPGVEGHTLFWFLTNMLHGRASIGENRASTILQKSGMHAKVSTEELTDWATVATQRNPQFAFKFHLCNSWLEMFLSIAVMYNRVYKTKIAWELPGWGGNIQTHHVDMCLLFWLFFLFIIIPLPFCWLQFFHKLYRMYLLSNQKERKFSSPSWLLFSEIIFSQTPTTHFSIYVLLLVLFSILKYRLPSQFFDNFLFSTSDSGSLLLSLRLYHSSCGKPGFAVFPTILLS